MLQGHSGRDLVDVLPAGSAGTSKRFLQIGFAEHRYLERRNVLASVPENARNPDQLVQKLGDAADLLFVLQFALFIERVPDAAEIHIRERHC